MELDYEQKYLKYKKKYLEIKFNGGTRGTISSERYRDQIGTKPFQAIYNTLKVPTKGLGTIGNHLVNTISRKYKCDKKIQILKKKNIKEIFEKLFLITELRNLLLTNISINSLMKNANTYETVKEYFHDKIKDISILNRLKNNISLAIQAFDMSLNIYKDKDFLNWTNPDELKYWKDKLMSSEFNSFDLNNYLFEAQDLKLNEQNELDKIDKIIFDYQKKINNFTIICPDEINELKKKWEKSYNPKISNNFIYKYTSDYYYKNNKKNLDTNIIDMLKIKIDNLHRTLELYNYILGFGRVQNIKIRIINILKELLEELDCYCNNDNLNDCLPENSLPKK